VHITLSRFSATVAPSLALFTVTTSQAYAMGAVLPESGSSSVYVPRTTNKVVVPTSLLIGKPAPDFEGLTSEGQTVKLSDFKGKIVVLEWHNPECPFVKKHYDSNNMQRLQTYARSEGVVWLTVNSSGEEREGYMDPRKAQAYYQEKNMQSNHYLIDPLGKIGGVYEAKTTPDIIVIDAGGNVAYSGAIDNKASADPADIPTSRNYVQSAIENLLLGKPASPFATQPYGCSIKYKTQN
jgi:hypothetical protein